MTISQKQVLDILAKVKVPGKDQDIVSLNMVSEIDIQGND